MKLLIDFETYSELDLSEVGSYKYAMHPSTRALMCAYKVLGSDEPPKLWVEGDPIPPEFKRFTQLFAHNAVFDYLIWSNTFALAPLAQWVDVMALCGKYSYPLGLGKAGDALGCDIKKNEEGMRLIRMFCRPSSFNRHNSPDDWERFCQYARDDVSAMETIIAALPKGFLNSRDQMLWEITQDINLRGVPVDRSEAEAIYRYTEAYKEEHSFRLPELTNGQVTKATQVQRIKKWVESEGWSMPDGLGAQLIEDALDDPNLPDHIAEVLAIRLEMGSSSSAKFKKIMDMEHNGRVHMNLIQFGATTGRYAGRGFQLHNLAKLTAKDPDDLINRFKNIDEVPNPPRAAKSLVRAMIKAPDGQKLVVADWTGIETHLLFWLVNDTEALSVLSSRGDLYRHMAASVYRIPVDDVCHDTQRPLGKALILGCGYGMGYRRFMEAAKTFGLSIDLPTANRAVTAYRAKYQSVVSAWYKLASTAKTALSQPGREMHAHRCVFQKVGTSLWLTLPSGRKLHYPMARVTDDGIAYWGVNATTKQWSEQRLIPGQIMENIIQAAAADILNHAVINVYLDIEFEMIGHVHDEIITLTYEAKPSAEKHLVDIMCQKPDWATDLPLFAEGYEARRFKK